MSTSLDRIKVVSEKIEQVDRRRRTKGAGRWMEVLVLYDTSKNIFGATTKIIQIRITIGLVCEARCRAIVSKTSMKGRCFK